MRHTKIVATIGPATDNDAAIAALITAGVDVFRLNFSHGARDVHQRTLDTIRRAAERQGRQIAVLQDLGGPKIRIGRIAGGGPLPLNDGETLRIATGDEDGRPGRVSTSYAELARAVSTGDRLLLDDGKLELRVESSDGAEIVTTVVHGGPLGERKGINAPGVRLPASSLTSKDIDDLRFGLAVGVDLVSLSFVQSAADLHAARAIMHDAGRVVPLIAKIERPEAVAAMDDVLAASDGIMVARGDLGLEIPLAQVPRVQKALTRGARERGLPVIVATQVFESMRSSPIPTRAEVSDAANAVDDGADAIMLSGETAVGEYPVRTVQTLDAVIRDAEQLPTQLPVTVGDKVIDVEHSRPLCEAAVTLAARGQARAIVAVTRKGNTARMLSAFRPSVPVLAATATPELARRLALYRGVVPVALSRGESALAAAEVEQTLVRRGLLAPGDVVVFVSVNADLSRHDANFLRLRRVSDNHPLSQF